MILKELYRFENAELSNTPRGGYVHIVLKPN